MFLGWTHYVHKTMHSVFGHVPAWICLCPLTEAYKVLITIMSRSEELLRLRNR